MTSSADKKASGNFLTEESPGETPSERKENLQLPPENEASDVDKVVSKKPTIVLTSEIAPQEEWAAQSGYEAKEGMKQVFTPNLNKGGAIGAGIYEIEQSEEDAESKDIDGGTKPSPKRESRDSLPAGIEESHSKPSGKLGICIYRCGKSGISAPAEIPDLACWWLPPPNPFFADYICGCAPFRRFF